MTAAILAGREGRELLCIVLADGSAHVGRYTIVASQRFLICADPGNLMGRVEGQLEEMDLATVEVLQTRVEALEEGRQRLMGDRVPGREPVTRDDLIINCGQSRARLPTSPRRIGNARSSSAATSTRWRNASIWRQLNASAHRRCCVCSMKRYPESGTTASGQLRS